MTILQADDETSITELSFLPDGRIMVFGMSREVLDLLGELALGDPVLARRYEQMHQAHVGWDKRACEPRPTESEAAIENEATTIDGGPARATQRVPPRLSHPTPDA
jgi:hypothetical protein